MNDSYDCGFVNYYNITISSFVLYFKKHRLCAPGSMTIAKKIVRYSFPTFQKINKCVSSLNTILISKQLLQIGIRSYKLYYSEALATSKMLYDEL